MLLVSWEVCDASATHFVALAIVHSLSRRCRACVQGGGGGGHIEERTRPLRSGRWRHAARHMHPSMHPGTEPGMRVPARSQACIQASMQLGMHPCIHLPPPLAQARPRSQKSGQNGGSTPTPCLDNAVHVRDTCDSQTGNNIVSHG